MNEPQQQTLSRAICPQYNRALAMSEAKIEIFQQQPSMRLIAKVAAFEGENRGLRRKRVFDGGGITVGGVGRIAFGVLPKERDFL